MGVDHRRGSAYPRNVAKRCCLLLTAALMLAPGAASAADSAPVESHVAVIVLENREYDEVVGSAEAPFLNGLAQRGALATRYHGVTHPSLPNYLAMIGGSTFGIDENCIDCLAHGPNLATQLSRAGISWRAYMGGLPYACYQGAEYGEYAKRHNPFMYFPSITSRPERCSRVVPETRLSADLRRHGLPAFAWVGPGLCKDAHDCALGVADRYLSGLVPRLTRQLGPHGLLVVTFDEGTSDATCCGGSDGGRTVTVLVGPDVPDGKRLKRPYDHYSLLATLEDGFGLPRLRHTRAARTMRAAFGRAPDFQFPTGS